MTFGLEPERVRSFLTHNRMERKRGSWVADDVPKLEKVAGDAVNKVKAKIVRTIGECGGEITCTFVEREANGTNCHPNLKFKFAMDGVECIVKARTDLLSKLHPPLVWTDAAILTMVPGLIEKHPLEWMGSGEVQCVGIGIAKEPAAIPDVCVVRSKGRLRETQPLAQVDETNRWVCHAGSRWDNPFSPQGFQVIDLNTQKLDVPLKKKPRLDLQNLRETNKRDLDQAIALATFLAEEVHAEENSREVSLGKALAQLEINPFEYPHTDEKSVIIVWRAKCNGEWSKYQASVRSRRLLIQALKAARGGA